MSAMPAIKKIVTPVDFSDNAQFILASAAELAASLGAELHIIFVVQNFVDYSGFMEPQMPMLNFDEELLKSARQRMDGFVDENQDILADKGIGRIVDKVLSGDVAEEIIDYATATKANLIIMGTHGYKGLDRLLFGSVATKVVQSSSCPVMTINPYTCDSE